MTSTIQVQTGSVKFPVSDSLYGLFFEDINRSGDGGLYPELLRNRAFDDSLLPDDLIPYGENVKNQTGWEYEIGYGEGLPRWRKELPQTDIPAWYAENAAISLDQADTLNPNRKAALTVSFQPDGAVSNIGFCGIPVQAGEAYHLYFFAKAEECIELVFSLQADGQVLASKSLGIRTRGYVRYELTLIPAGTSKTAQLVISAPNGGKVKFGFISLMPTESYHGHGLRKDLCEKLEGLHPAFMRFPGGCIVEGFSKSTAQRFQRMVGDVWERPGVYNLWGYHSTEGLGFHEYLQLCEDMGTDALYVCNCGMTCQARRCILMDDNEIQEYLDDAMCALEYALGGSDTKWGALRAKMGHPAPFRLKYLEIGNENNGPEYDRRYKIFYDAITAKYPELIIVANTHVEKSGLPLDIADEHFYNRVEWFAENAHFYDSYDRQGPGIFVGEYAVVAGNIRTLYAAVGEAMFLIGLERNQDIVKLASYAPLFENVRYAAWEPNLIVFDGLDNYCIPSYYVQQLFAANRGKAVLESRQTCPPVYAPYLKGGACMLGDAGVPFKNPKWNGSPVAPNHELYGCISGCEDGVYTTAPDIKDENPERAERFGMTHAVMIVMGDDETSRSGSFEVEVYADGQHELGVGLFTAPYGSAHNSADSPYNIFSVQPVRWTIGTDGKTQLTAGGGHHRQVLTEAEVSVVAGQYHTMQITADGKRIICVLDGTPILTAELPHYDSIQSVVTADGDSVLIKIVNIADCENEIQITLDCDVAPAYTASVLSGDPAAKNTLVEPETVVPRTVSCTSAGKAFTHTVPACSVTVLKLQKA